ncbi:putative anti-sigmaE protein [Hartmannibacter diazotrophicus]|uniref:Putative anti-sigmaE protein n=1 Tax=Hartmannibacter diazotrophicus TaxID=1482074 RepID=A0A2C9D993_9HYPH|nr:anti-sigma factor [Hartmannibacter diazotrophicus]SON56718.1 putative anti-sigmaE protein [Hartmannibacter diazotrophicus]
MNERPISEDDLQAYVDGRLDQVRHAEIEAYLEAHPQEAERLASYQRQREQLKAALRPIAEEPIPSELNLARLVQDNRKALRRHSWRDAAAAVVLLGAGLAGGWSLHGGMPAGTEGVTALASEAADSYAVYASDHVRPVEITAADSRDLVSWTSDRLRHPLTIPDLERAGYRFMGGRLVATPHGPAVMLMYDDDRGTRLVMVTRKMAADKNAPMSETRSGNLTGYTWANDGIGYSLVGPVAPQDLHPVADEIRQQTTQNV